MIVNDFSNTTGEILNYAKEKGEDIFNRGRDKAVEYANKAGGKGWSD